MFRPVSSGTIRWLLFLALVLGATSAFLGMYLALSGNGDALVDHLSRTPFSSAVVPGLILGLVVGGTQLAAAIALALRARAALVLASVAGFGLLIWIFTEVAMLLVYSPLQAFYFGVGILELVFLLTLLGVDPLIAEPENPLTTDVGGPR